MVKRKQQSGEMERKVFHGPNVLKTVYISGCQTIGCKNINFNTDPVKKIRNFKFHFFYLKVAETTDGMADYRKEILPTVSAKLESRANGE